MTMEERIEQKITDVDLATIEVGLQATDLDLRLLELESVGETNE